MKYMAFCGEENENWTAYLKNAVSILVPYIYKLLLVLYPYLWARIAVSIVTRYRLDGPGSNPGGGAIFRTRPDRPWGPPSLLYNRYQAFSRGKAARAWR